MWNTVKRLSQNNRSGGRKTSTGKGMKNIFNKILKDNFPDLKKKMLVKVQEAKRTPIERTRRKSHLST